MFRKTIAVLLLFSIVLSSCGKKDGRNDPTRTRPPTEAEVQKEVSKVLQAEVQKEVSKVLSPPPLRTPPVVTSLLEATDACIAVHLSCPVPSKACIEAKAKDSKRLNANLWQACIDSPPCSEKRETFRKAKLACLNSEIDYNKAYQYCSKAEAMCYDAGYNCPLAQLVRAEVLKKQPKSSLSCNSHNSCPEAKLSRPKVDLAFSEAEKVCNDTNISRNACPKAWGDFYDFRLQFLVDVKSCIESELNGTSSAEWAE